MSQLACVSQPKSVVSVQRLSAGQLGSRGSANTCLQGREGPTVDTGLGTMAMVDRIPENGVRSSVPPDVKE